MKSEMTSETVSISGLPVRYRDARPNPQRRTQMRIRYFLISGLLASAAIYAASPKSETSADGPAAYARLKTLAGEWEANTADGKAHLKLELIAGGTALVERETAEKMPAMETVYYLDGAR